MKGEGEGASGDKPRECMAWGRRGWERRGSSQRRDVTPKLAGHLSSRGAASRGKQCWAPRVGHRGKDRPISIVIVGS